jgi:hypothetical protein
VQHPSRLDEIDPTGDKLLTRSEFLAWWNGHTSHYRRERARGDSRASSSAVQPVSPVGTGHGLDDSRRQAAPPLQQQQYIVDAVVAAAPPAASSGFEDVEALLASADDMLRNVELTTHPRGYSYGTGTGSGDALVVRGDGFDGSLVPATASPPSHALMAVPPPAPTPSPAARLFDRAAAVPLPSPCVIVKPLSVAATASSWRSSLLSRGGAAGGGAHGQQLGLSFALGSVMQTVEEARLSVVPGQLESHSGKLVAGNGFAVDMAAIAANVRDVVFDESEWNERWQRLLEKSAWSFERSLERGVALAAMEGKLARAAMEIVETIIDEMSLPVAFKSVKPFDDADDDDGHGEEKAAPSASKSKPLYFHKGLVVQVFVDPTDADSSCVPAYQCACVPACLWTSSRACLTSCVRGVL